MKDRRQFILITVLCSLLSAAIAVLATVVVLQKLGRLNTMQPAARTDGSVFNSSKLDEMEQMIQAYFIGEADEDAVTERMADAMIKGLGDEWSYYIPADEYDAYQESVNNAYVGIGITIIWEDEDPKGFRITDVTPDGPAYRAGIVIGDYLTAVEGKRVSEMGMTEAKNCVRGEEGTDVTVTILHGEVERDLTITRESIKVVNVTSELLEDGIGYLRIRNFEQDCAADTIAAIEALQAQGANSLIFDVRFNPGGLKSELVALLDYLLPEGPLFRSVNYLGQENVDYSDAAHVDLPMAVLVNVDSYSAAEFFAAALQEYGAAKVVGTQTYGKGYFQTALRLSDGSAINLSIGKYTTPNGVSLVGVGITPDRVVELSEEEYADLYYSRTEREADRQLQAAVEAVK